MINTYRYGGQGKQNQDGRETIVQISPPTVLNRFGAFLQVSITHPKSVQQDFQKKGESTPTLTIKAMIDTGASGTVITPKIAESLKLIHTGYQNVLSVQDEQKRPVYYGFIIFPWGRGKEIPMIACPLKGGSFECLIGRDILMHWHFTYNGTDGSITICD
ncbi:MAG: retropepsin-like aspartic protease [bacterium]